MISIKDVDNLIVLRASSVRVNRKLSLSLKNYRNVILFYIPFQLRLLTVMCPKLTHVSLYVDEDAGNLLEPLTSLKELSEIKLLACNFYTDKVDELLKWQGKQLTLLHLEHIDELDMNALCCIAENCPNLLRLVFFSCDFVENFGHSLSDKKFSHPPFQLLQSLVCVRLVFHVQLFENKMRLFRQFPKGPGIF